MNWIQSVTTNVKSPDGEATTTDLGPKTLLVGPNESGKSTIAEALQLSLSGSAYGVLWRSKEVKDSKLLIALSPQGKGVFAESLVSDGSTARWALEAGKRATREGTNGMTFPVSELHTILSGSPSTLRTFLFRNLLGSASTDSVRDLLPPSVLPVFNGFVGESAMVDLTEILKGIAKNKRLCSDRTKAAKSVLSACGEVRRVTNDEVDRLWLELAKSQRFEKLKEMYRMYRAGESLGNEDQNIALNRVRKMLSQLGSTEELQSMTSATKAKESLEFALREQGALSVITKARNRIDVEEGMATQLAQLEKKLILALDTIVSTETDNFSEKISSYLPEGEEFIIDVDGNSSTIGLRRDGELHTALSGSTEARTIAAIGAALVDYRCAIGATDAGVLIVDDRMWDAKTLGQTMTALEDSPCQVIIMSTIKPKGRQRIGWTYVDVERA